MKPVLLIGGTGVVGSQIARQLRAAHPTLPLLIAARDGAKAAALATELGYAEGISLDLGAADLPADLGLGERAIGAIAILFKDERVAALRYAQQHGIPFVSISSMLPEIAPEIAAYVTRTKAPLVLGGCWLVGLTAVGARLAAASLPSPQAIHIGAVLDAEDFGGPTAHIDSARMEMFGAGALRRRAGFYTWDSGDALAASITASDGTTLEAFGYSSSDVPILAETTPAQDIAFDLAIREGADGRNASEIVYTITASDGAKTRYGLSHPQGQPPLTALGVTMVLERLAGLTGAPLAPSLLFADALIDDASFAARLAAIGGLFGPL